MSTGHGLHKLTGGIAKREREAWGRLPSQTCALPSCDEPAAALIQRWNGPYTPICVGHAPEAIERGYSVRWPEESPGE